MHNYIKETILNSLEGVKKYDNILCIPRVNNYDLTKLCSDVIKNDPVEGKHAQITITAVDAGDLADGKHAEYKVFVKSDSELGEFAYPNYQEFGKPLIVDLDEEASKDEERGISNAFRLALVENSSMPVRVVVDESDDKKVVLKANDYRVSFDVVVSVVTPHTQTEAEKVEDKSKDCVKVNQENVIPFATGSWLIENLRFPTYYNRRYEPLYADEAPVRNGKYVQFSFDYKTFGEESMNGFGYPVPSVTTHVFYVLQGAGKGPEGDDVADLAAEFEGMLKAAVSLPDADKYDTDKSPIEGDKVNS